MKGRSSDVADGGRVAMAAAEDETGSSTVDITDVASGNEQLLLLREMLVKPYSCDLRYAQLRLLICSFLAFLTILTYINQPRF